jgi:3-methyladenine DNA glycosylase/8-oxoguanine DNA glycosylase
VTGVVRRLKPRLPVDLGLTLGVLRRGRVDPTMRMAPAEVWRATRTPEGPVTTRITARAGVLTMQAWGPGTAAAVEGFPDLVGADDDEAGFDPGQGVVHELRRRLRGLRLCRTGAVVEALVPTILEQKVVGIEAKRSYARLVRALGDPAPGPPAAAAGLRVPPSPERLARTPSYVFHRFGVERKRADTIRVACSYAARLEELVSLPLAAAYARLTALPGMGPWSAAEVALLALGDADAVSVGDYHLPHQVAFALAGEPRADDDRMLELLEPYRGHRGRVIRLIEAGAAPPPRYGPRLPLQRISVL